MCIMVPSAKRSTDVIPRDLVSFMERVLSAAGGKEAEVRKGRFQVSLHSVHGSTVASVGLAGELAFNPLCPGGCPEVWGPVCLPALKLEGVRCLSASLSSLLASHRNHPACI